MSDHGRRMDPAPEGRFEPMTSVDPSGEVALPEVDRGPAPRPRLTVALTFDGDAISDAVRRDDPPVKLSHGEFGIRVGIPRILDLLEREAIPATWFMPGHTVETWPAVSREIAERGHELACHGWYHEDFSAITAREQRAILERSREAVGQVAGDPPRGYRAPYWALGPETLELVEAAGFTYDSSLMADDYRLYRVRHGDRHSTSGPTTFGTEGALVEVPIYWGLDDWPYFEPVRDTGRDGLSAPSRVLEIWTGELRYAWEHAPGGLLTVTMHPECIGRGHRMAMLERFIAEARDLEGVVFDRLDHYVDRWLGGA
ncbi:MAG TPA: polysaccharide deacetylase [Candidatus Limnocylindrales bacterium]|nr:polysaccharide deacetylase [Candidatus Limnocylindrales bacterium]